MIPFVDLKTQYQALKSDIQRRIERVLDHGQYIMGPEVRELEESLEARIGADFCVTVGSGTEALLISLMALGIGLGDEVITTPFTFAATVEVIVLLGARPVFVDIEPDTCNINAALIEERITPRTKAIIPVSLYGQPADMDEINAIAARNGNIAVIEDAAQSFGATYRNRNSGNLSTIGCTSFFPSKPLGCYGDGGAIFTNDGDIARACREIRVHGQSERYVHSRLGVGGRMDTLQCAVVLAKLERFDWEIEQRIAIGIRYRKLLEGCTEALPVSVRNDRTSVHAQFTLRAADGNRESIIERLGERGVPTAIHYPTPLNAQPAYRMHAGDSAETPQSTIASRCVFSIPMSADLTSSDQSAIVRAIRGN